MSELLLVIKLTAQRNFYFYKCLSCSCRAFKTLENYRCKNGHVHSNKTMEFCFSILGISLKSLKVSRKTIFGKSLFNVMRNYQILGESQDKILNLLSDLLVGQIASIKSQNNVITLFKLRAATTVVDFLQQQEIQFKIDTTTQTLLVPRKKYVKESLLKESFKYVLEFLTWQEWFRDQIDQELEEEFSNPILDDLALKISDINLI